MKMNPSHPVAVYARAESRARSMLIHFDDPQSAWIETYKTIGKHKKRAHLTNLVMLGIIARRSAVLAFVKVY